MQRLATALALIGAVFGYTLGRGALSTQTAFAASLTLSNSLILTDPTSGARA
jgi:hypothetical protein